MPFAGLSTPAPTADSPQDPFAQLDPATRRLLAETLYGEGANQGPQGLEAILEVIGNRARMSGQSIADVLNTSGAFTSMRPGATRSRLDTLSDEKLDPEFNAITLHKGARPLLGPNAAYYYNPTLQAALNKQNPSEYPITPGFAQGQKPEARIGEHVFYDGTYKGGPTKTGNPITDGANSDIAKFYDDLQNTPEMKVARERIAQADAMTPQVLEALDKKAKMYDDMLGRIDGLIRQQQQIRTPNAEAPMPSEAEFEREELAKVSNKPNDPTRALGQFLPMLAILGGAVTRNGAIGAIKAAGAAMAAAKQNDKDALQRAHEHFIDAQQQVLDRFQMQQQEFQDEVLKNKDSMTDLLSAMEVYGAKYDIPGLKQAALQGDVQTAFAWPEMMMKVLSPLAAIQRSNLAGELQRIKLEAALQNMNAGKQLTDDDLWALAKQSILTGKDPPLGFAGQPELRDRYIKIKAEAELHPDWDGPGGGISTSQPAAPGATTPAPGAAPAALTPSAAGANAATTAASMKADTLALDQTNKQVAAVGAYVESFKRIGQLARGQVDQAAGPLWGPAWNKPVQWVRVNMAGDPKVARLNLLINSIENEYGKIVTGSTGSVRAVSDSTQKRMAELISGNMTVAQVAELIGTMQQEAEIRLEGFQHTAQYIQQNMQSLGSGHPTPPGGGTAPGGLPAGVRSIEEVH